MDVALIPQNSWSPVELGEYCAQLNKRMADDAWRMGRALIIAKGKLKHGEWLTWLKTYCPTLSATTRSRYTRLAEQFGEDELQGVAITEAYRRAGLVKSPSDDTSEADLARTTPEERPPGTDHRPGRLRVDPDSSAASVSPPVVTSESPPIELEEDDLDPAAALTEVMRGLTHRMGLLSEDIALIRSQDQAQRATCWPQIDTERVARALNALRAHLAWLSGEIPHSLAV